MINLDSLKESVFLDGFTDRDLVSLGSIAKSTHWSEGETLFEARSPATHFYILESGTLLLYFPNGRSFPVRERGQAIGWSSLITPFYYTATGLSLTEASLYEFSRSELYRLIQMESDLGHRLMQKLAGIMGERKPYRRALHNNGS